MSLKFRTILACLVLVIPQQAPGIILDCEVATDGTYTCVEIHGTVVTEGTREKVKAGQREYYERALDMCEYKEPKRRAMSKTSGALMMEKRKKAQQDYDACIASKAEQLRKADKTDDPE